MTYIRIKNISNNPYAYLVESQKTSSGPRQKVKQYLGRVYKIEKKNLFTVNDTDVLNNLVLSELKSRGFKEKKRSFVYNNLIYSKKDFSLTKKIKFENKKEAVIKLNNGYLCSFSLQRIVNFKKTTDLNKDAHRLAKYFLQAGLEISEEDFVQFYQGL